MFINYFFAQRIRSISYKSMERQAQVSRDFQEVLSGAEVVKAHVSEEREVEKISGRIRKLFRTRLQSAFLSSITGSLTNGVRLIVTILVVMLSVKQVKQGVMTVGDVTAFIAYVLNLSSLAIGISGSFLMLQPVFASMQRVMEMFNIVPEFSNDDKSRRLIKPRGIEGEIKFENVSFAYEEGKTVLKDLSFTVRPGDIIALTGVSGAGKTTLINLLLKFNLPKSGRILLDNVDINDIDTKWLRERMGIVSQEVFLFNDSLENNIKYGKPGAALKEVKKAARDAQIHNDIEEIESGYDSMVGERGVNLSAGQRQRISLARAFLRDPAILIFDEPTSALDTETESAIQDSLAKL